MNRPVAVPALERQEIRALSANRRTDGERAFRRAARHSRFIRLLRVAIPIGVMASFGVVLAVTFNPFRAPANVSFDKGKLAVSGTKIAMEFPRLTGFTRDLLPYELTARVASQDIVQPGVLELKDLRAQVQTKDQDVLEVSAATGTFHIKSDTLRLVDDILVRSKMGYEARLQEALLDLKKGTVVSERRVETRFPEGTLQSNRLDISENGSVVLFSRGVEVFLLAADEKSKSAAPAASR